MKKLKMTLAAVLALTTMLCADTWDGWSKFKPGSYAKYKTTTAVAGTKMSSEMKMTLVGVSGNKATIETEVTAMGNTTKTKSEAPLSGASSAPAQSPAKKGSESVTVNGKSFNCDVYEVDSSANGMKVHTKTWVSSQVPGGMVKSVSSSSGAAKTETTVELVDFKN